MGSPASLYILVVVGLCFEIIGAFFVAVEAIKLENFRRLYRLLDEVASENVIDDLSTGLWRAIRHLKFAHLRKAYQRVRRYRTWRLFCITIVLFLVLTTVFSTYLVTSSRPPILLPVGIILFFAVRILFLSGAGAELRFVLRVLDFIEAKTPSGFVGVIGFLCLLIGFVLQAGANFLFAAR